MFQLLGRRGNHRRKQSGVKLVWSASPHRGHHRDAPCLPVTASYRSALLAACSVRSGGASDHSSWDTDLQDILVDWVVARVRQRALTQVLQGMEERERTVAKAVTVAVAER